MDSIIAYFSSFGLDFLIFSKSAVILLVGALLICGICRFIFKKKTMISHAVSSSIAIVFIYFVMTLIITVATQLQFLVTPLPLAAFSQEKICFFPVNGSDYLTLASELLSMIQLAFLVNLLDIWMPKGKSLFTWFLYRCVTVILGLLLHYVLHWVLETYVPEGIATYAPTILLAILIIMLLTGALRFLVGLLLTTVNPLIAALYTFFFATLVGKQLTQAVMTTGIITGIMIFVQNAGITSLSVASGALIAYIPFLLILIPVWYLVSRY